MLNYFAMDADNIIKKKKKKRKRKIWIILNNFSLKLINNDMNLIMIALIEMIAFIEK